MACYKFKIDGVDTEISIPSSITKDEDVNLTSLLQDLISHTNDQKSQFIVETDIQKLSRLLNVSKENRQKGIDSILEIDKREAFNLIQQHLNRIGVTLHLIDSQSEMQSLGFPESTLAGIQNGEIYVLTTAPISAPMHEFLHLVFGVIKQDNFSKFLNITHLLDDVQEFKEILETVQNNSEYKNLIDADQREEAFVRFIENVIDGRIDPNNFENIEQQINKELVPYIKTTFGLSEVSGVLDFLKSPLSSLTKQGSSLFVRKSLKTTGYSDKKYKVVLSGKIMNLINELSSGENPIIQKGECE